MFNKRLKELEGVMRNYRDNARTQKDTIRTMQRQLNMLQFEVQCKPEFKVGDKIGELQVVGIAIMGHNVFVVNGVDYYYSYSCFDLKKKRTTPFTEKDLVRFKNNLTFK